MNGKELWRDEIKAVWTIDRSEIIDAIYYLRHKAYLKVSCKICQV